MNRPDIARWMTKSGAALLAITILGLALRVYHLGTQSFWADEVISVGIANHSLPRIVQLVIAYDTHPPLYYFALHYWMILFGSSEFAVRLLSLIFGVLAIPMIYVLGRKLFNREVGLVGAFLLAISQFNIQYSQEARMYSMFFLFALLSMYFFVGFLQEDGLAVVFGYVLSTTLMLYSHMFSVFVLVIQNVFLAGLIVASRTERYRLRRWLPTQAIVLVIFAPWLSVLPQQLHSAQIAAFKNVDPITLVLDHATGLYGVYYAQIAQLLLLLGLVALALFTYNRSAQSAFKGYAWDRGNLKFVCLLFAWFLGVIGLPFLIAPLIKHSLIVPRYMIAATAPLIILVAKGVRTIRFTRAKVAVLAIIVVLSAVNLQTYYATTRNDPTIRDAVTYVNKNAHGGDLVIFVPNGLMYSYYTFRPYLTARGFGRDSFNVDNASTTRSTLMSDAKGHERVWLVTPGASEDLRRAFSNYFDSSYYLTNTTGGLTNPNVRMYVQRP